MVKDSYAANKQIIFGGDNYDEAWHAEAEQRGLKNLRTTPDALPEVLADADGRGVRQVRGALRARARVALRGLARAVHHQRQHRGRDRARHREDDDPAGGAAPPATGRRREHHRDRARRGQTQGAGRPTCSPAIGKLEEANAYPDGVEGMELAEYARDSQIAAMADVREVADKLEERRRRRPLAAAEVLGDPVRPLTRGARGASPGLKALTPRRPRDGERSGRR